MSTDLTPEKKVLMLERIKTSATKYLMRNVEYLDYLFNNVVDSVFEIYFWDVETDWVVGVSITKKEGDYHYHLGSSEKYTSFTSTRKLVSHDPIDVKVYQVGIEPFYANKHLKNTRNNISPPNLFHMSEEDAYDHIGEGNGVFIKKNGNTRYYEADEVAVKTLYYADEVFQQDPEDTMHRHILQYLVRNLDEYCVYLSNGDRTVDMHPSDTGEGFFLKLTHDLKYLSLDSSYVGVDVYDNTFYVDGSDSVVIIKVINKDSHVQHLHIKRLSSRVVTIKPFKVLG